MKKIISVVLSVIMLLSIVPITASAATVSGTCGDNLTWTYNTSTCTLTISGTGPMYDYDYGTRPWETYEDSIKKVIIEDGVTTIGDYAFVLCGRLISVTIGDSVTTIGDAAFAYCANLTSVTIPENVTSIGGCAFLSYKALLSITVNGDNQYYSNDEYGVLFNKDKTILIQYPVGNTRTSYTIPESVTTIAVGAFMFCDSLTNIMVDSNNLSFSSDEYGVLFNKDKTILVQYPIGNTRTSYTIPDGVTTIDDFSFFSRNSLTRVIISDSVTTIGDSAFYWCDNLTSVTIGNSVTSVGEFAFYGCNSLTCITIPDSITTIGEKAFENCASLKDVYYSGTEKEWNKISIGPDNASLLSAIIHFNSCEHKYNSLVTSPTCTSHGYATYFCSICGDSYVDNYVDATGHSYESTVTAPTCIEKGFTTYTCSICNDTYVDNYVDAIGHKYNEVVTQPTCEQNGYTTCTCECGDTYIANIISPTGHADNDKDGYCDICDELLCDHDCHRGGFAGFFWKISNFFNKLFGTNKYCECGAAHY